MLLYIGGCVRKVIDAGAPEAALGVADILHGKVARASCPSGLHVYPTVRDRSPGTCSGARNAC